MPARCGTILARNKAPFRTPAAAAAVAIFALTLGMENIYYVFTLAENSIVEALQLVALL